MSYISCVHAASPHVSLFTLTLKLSAQASHETGTCTRRRFTLASSFLTRSKRKQQSRLSSGRTWNPCPKDFCALQECWAYVRQTPPNHSIWFHLLWENSPRLYILICHNMSISTAQWQTHMVWNTELWFSFSVFIRAVALKVTQVLYGGPRIDGNQCSQSDVLAKIGTNHLWI